MTDKYRILSPIVLLVLFAFSAVCSRAEEEEHNEWNLKLWCKQPAKKWNEALPVGNGRLGAMVFGETQNERIQLNESTLWTGGPYDPNGTGDPKVLSEIRKLVNEGKYFEAQHLFGRKMMGYPIEQQKYQSLGNLWLTFPGHDKATEYRRELDLDQAIARVSYKVGDVRYTREILVSAPEKVIAIRLTADKPGSISLTAQLYGERNPVSYDDNNFTSDGVAPDQLVLRGKSASFVGIVGRVQYEARMRAFADGGIVRVEYSSLSVEKADAVTLIIAAATNVVNYNDISANQTDRVKGVLARVEARTFDQIRSSHIADHQRLFHRMAIDLESTESAKLPTDERIKNLSKERDPSLAALYLQYGRYLLIASSRPGGEPANLQGLWNQDMNPWWESKYTTNINLEMNYWPAEPMNLAECAEPLFSLIRDVSVTGRKTAKVKYGAQGWVLHQNTDLWRATASMDGPTWGTWTTGGAWLCTHLWDHYLFTGDKEFLKQSYPIIKESVRFFLDFLTEDASHERLVTNPSMSPENFPQWGVNKRYLDETCGIYLPGTTIAAGTTMDMQILRSLFDAYVQSAEILKVDADIREQVKGIRTRLAPNLIGKDGELQEWIQDWKSLEPQHRHLSHLWGLFPGEEITPAKTPALAEAARKSLVARGEGGCGWSIAWKNALWARLLDGENAYASFKNLMTKNVFPNLFSRCGEALQIDGTLGTTAALGEMILQSHSGEISLLPALPKDWPSGSVKGMRTRGGFEVDIEWNEGKLANAVIRSLRGNPLVLRYGKRTAKTATIEGKSYLINASLDITTR